MTKNSGIFNFERRVCRPQEAKKDLIWWVNNLKLSNGRSLMNPNYNIKCINERLGDLLSGSEDWEVTIKAASKGTYKHIGAESSKVFYIDLYKNLLTSQNNPFANGQYSGTFLYCQNGGSTYKKVLSDLA